MSVVIRSAIAKDIPFILEGYHEVNRSVPMETADMLTADRIHSDILAHDPKAFIDVAELDGEPVGFVFYSFVYFASTGQVIWVTNIYVDPLARRAGYARQFIQHIQERFPHCKGIYGVTEKDNHNAHKAFSEIGSAFFPHFLFIGIKKQ